MPEWMLEHAVCWWADLLASQPERLQDSSKYFSTFFDIPWPGFFRSVGLRGLAPAPLATPSHQEDEIPTSRFCKAF